MKRLTITLFILATLLLNMLPACDGLDDHYSTNPTYRLSFSTDTLAFDTSGRKRGEKKRKGKRRRKKKKEGEKRKEKR